MIAHNDKYIELFNRIKTDGRIFNSSGKINSAFLKKNDFLNSQLFLDIIDCTNFLDQNSSMSERIFCIRNKIKNVQICLCGKRLKFISNIVGYLDSCYKCIRKVNTDWKNPSETILKNVKLEYEDLLNYINDPNTEKASYEEILEFINTKKLNCAESKKWIYRNEIKERKAILKGIVSLTKQIPIQDYEYNWSQRIYNIVHNIKEDPICSICGIAKLNYVNFLKGYRKSCSNKECSQRICCDNRINNHIETIKPFINDQGFKLLIDDSFKGLNYSKIELECEKCNNKFLYDISDGKWKRIICAGCHGNKAFSYEEKEVLEYIKTFEFDVLENQKIFSDSLKEVDIYIPNKKIAIEYNGCLWHSFGKMYPNNIDKMQTHKNNHYYKFEQCKNNGVRLFQINSTEWTNPIKQKIWKSILKNKLGMVKKLYARNCKIIEISTQEKNDFLNKNHLQGMDNSKIKLGLIHDNQLVSIMTFSKPRFNKNYEWELVRFCNLLDYAVIGGASKLLKFFINNYNPKTIISYADLRYSDGNLYNKIGFKFKHVTPPSYVYVKHEVVISRFTAQKHRLKNLLKDFDESKTESENMLDNGFRKMWDAGNFLFVLNIENFK